MWGLVLPRGGVGRIGMGPKFGESRVETELLLRVFDCIANGEDSNKKDVHPKY